MMVDPLRPIPASHAVPLRTKIAYGIGAIAYGVKDNGFAVFLGFYYNQIIGLPSAAVGIAIACALVFDALIDPLLGILSDRTKSRLGRRHPWLYASALPIAISWLLLWYPPAGSDSVILAWLGVTAIMTRAAIAVNEVPSLALAPELTPDYHERTLVLRYRFLFGWAGGLGILMLAYGVLLAPPYGALSGPNAVAGFQLYGWVGAIAMAVTILISAWGTQKFTLSVLQPPVAHLPMRETLAQARITLTNRAFVLLMIAGVFGYTNQGVGFAISQYTLSFVWQFGNADIVWHTISLLFAAALAFALATPISRRFGKPKAAAILAIVGAILNMMPYILRFAGMFPLPGSDAVLPAFLAFNASGTGLGITAMIIGASMMSDVVEASQEETGRREEGLFFAGNLFVQKCATGIGVLIIGLVLAASQFPEKAVAGQVSKATIDTLTAYLIALTLGITTGTAIMFWRFPFGKAEHDARLDRLQRPMDPNISTSS
jgi:GPH family glycoside/pentoside/hexuronide:cation symporter